MHRKTVVSPGHYFVTASADTFVTIWRFLVFSGHNFTLFTVQCLLVSIIKERHAYIHWRKNFSGTLENRETAKV